MIDDQQKFVIFALVLIGIALVYYLLSWTSQFQHADWTPVFIAYEDLDPFGHVERWGLYTRYGQSGAIFGAIVPLLLFAVAAYLAASLRCAAKAGPRRRRTTQSWATVFLSNRKYRCLRKKRNGGFLVLFLQNNHLIVRVPQ